MPPLLSLVFLLTGPLHAGAPPTSARSRAAVDRQVPPLTAALAEARLSLGAPVHLRIYKEEAELEVWLRDGDSFQRFRTYPICTFSGELGPKQQRGDMQAPEGFYFVTPQRMNPWSQFHLSFNLGYPNAYDRSHGRTGSLLMVHGDCASLGCYAMTDAGIEEIWTVMDAAFRAGQPFVRVHAFPFRMSAEAVSAHAADSPEWAAFWANLLEGAELFEETLRPPDARVEGGRYVFRR